MRSDLRIAGSFNPEVAARFGMPGLTTAIIIDDEAGLLHTVNIEYAVEEDQLFRRLTYTLTAMSTMKKVGVWKNEIAQQLLYKIATALGGSTLSEGRAFEKAMFILPRDQVWDEVLPTDKAPKKKVVPKKEKEEAENE